MATIETFPVQSEVRGPWRRFIDDLVPLRPDLFRYCCGLTGNVWDGEDLAQDTLLRVFGHLGKINADLENPRAYLIRSATHLWIDRVRRAGVERRLAKDQVDSAPAVADDDPSQVMAVREAAASLFGNLSPQERASVLLKDVLDFSLEETAAMLKTTVGAVKSALHGGRARLRAAKDAPVAACSVPRGLVDRFVAALNAQDLDAIRALCLADVTVDMVGGACFESWEEGKITLEYAHMVIPALGMGADPRWIEVDYRGEPIAVGLRTKDDLEGINEIWRLEADDGRLSRIRLYCFTPDLLRAVGRDLGLPAAPRPYRSPP